MLKIGFPKTIIFISTCSSFIYTISKKCHIIGVWLSTLASSKNSSGEYSKSKRVKKVSSDAEDENLAQWLFNEYENLSYSNLLKNKSSY